MHPSKATRTPRRPVSPVQPGQNVKMTSVCAGHLPGGAPRRNRTGDPILTMEPPGTAVRTAVLAGHAGPSGPKLSVLFQRSYALTSNQVLIIAGEAMIVIRSG